MKREYTQGDIVTILREVEHASRELAQLPVDCMAVLTGAAIRGGSYDPRWIRNRVIYAINRLGDAMKVCDEVEGIEPLTEPRTEAC